MGKKSKKEPKSKKESRKGSKSKKGETSEPKKPKGLQIDPELLKELTKDLNDVFRFKNEDVYIGQFIITVDGGILRHGRGKYFSGDGCVFCGLWENDLLVEAEKISYPDGSWYRGALELETGKYTGQGIYNLPRLGSLDCAFVQGRPLGPVTLTDKDDNKWQGRAGAGHLTLVPRNHLFDSEDAICLQMAKNTDSTTSEQKKSLHSKNED